MLLGAFACLTVFQTLVTGDDTGFKYDGHTYKSKDNFEFSRGEMVVFYDTEEICDSWVLVPGVILIDNGLLGFFYLVCLLWLFLGISIVSDIFMGAIEVITSSTREVTKIDPITRKFFLTCRRDYHRDSQGMEPHSGKPNAYGSWIKRPRDLALSDRNSSKSRQARR